MFTVNQCEALHLQISRNYSSLPGASTAIKKLAR